MKNKNPLSFHLAPHSGFIVPHAAQMVHLIQGHSLAGDFLVEKRTIGNRPWQEHYGFPSHGISLFYNYTGNPAAFGTFTSLGYSLRLPLDKFKVIESKKELNGFSIRNMHDIILGIGPGYSTKIWDLRENHQAPVLGSHINVALSIQYQVKIPLSSKVNLASGLRITHFSNGAFQIPNLGANNVSIYVGCTFHHSGLPQAFTANVPEQKFKKSTSTLAFSFGMKEIQPPLGKKYETFTLSFLQDRRVTYKSSLGLGLDAFYNTSLKPLMERYKNETPTTIKVMQLGALLSYSLHFNLVELKIQQGFYLKDNWKNDGVLYHRFGLRYRFSNHCFAQLMLKTHFAKADYGEVGLGYAF